MNKNIGKLSSKVKEGEIVRKANVYRFVMFTIVFMFIFSALAFAQGQDAFKIQGLIMNVDFQKKVMIVNESTFIWDQNTKFYNDKGSPVTVDKLRAKTWVYIQGVKDSAGKRMMAEKIYILPKYIDKKEKHLYPFFNETRSIDND
jgi:hypothetical protein